MKRKYSAITKESVIELTSILGEKGISLKEHDLEACSHDEGALVASHSPDIVLKPSSAVEVSAILKFAGIKKIPVTPRGAGTGLSGGCTPIHGGIVLSMERMNRILEIDADNFLAVVEPGVSLSQLNLEAGQFGLQYPVHLGDMSASIGGTVATNAGGMNAVKYGVTRHQILGLEAVLPEGDIIETGGRFVKCSTGYDLTQLLIGSEGTLAVVTKIILKLTRLAKYRELLFIPFNNLQDAVDTVPEILKLNTVPVGLELIEKDVISLVEKAFDIEVPFAENEAFLLVLTENDSFDDVLHFFKEIEEICLHHNAVEFLAPDDERAKRKIIEMREKIYPALQKSGPFALIDTVVPRSRIAQFIRDVKTTAAGLDMVVLASGHAGDGNIHLHPVCIDGDRDKWLLKLPGLMQEIFQMCALYGGAVSGEHGIGLDKKPYLPLTVNGNSLRLMKRLKQTFDPASILNPGKVFDL